MSATENLSIFSALGCAIETLKEQPNEVPEIPSGWVQEACAALSSRDEKRMHACAAVIRKAHSNYRAAFDEKPWLFELRKIYMDSF